VDYFVNRVHKRGTRVLADSNATVFTARFTTGMRVTPAQEEVHCCERDLRVKMRERLPMT
jgi:hypothetical protein